MNLFSLIHREYEALKDISDETPCKEEKAETMHSSPRRLCVRQAVRYSFAKP